MNSILRFLVLFAVFYIVNAQWRGDIGYQKNRRNWQLRGGVSYNFNRGRTRAHVGGHGFINSRGQRGYGVNAGFKRTFAGGRGSYGVNGFRNSRGGYGYQAHFRYKFGRKRRSIFEDSQLRQICKECITIETVTSPEKLEQYADIHNVKFGMIARFKRFYDNENETVLSFKVKQIIAEAPTDFNISEANVFNIFATKSSCAMVCLRGFVREDYLITGSMFHGRLIIHDTVLLFHAVQGQQPVGETVESKSEDEAQQQNEDAKKEEDGEDDDEEGDTGHKDDDVEVQDEDGGLGKSDDADAEETGPGIKQQQDEDEDDHKGKLIEPIILNNNDGTGKDNSTLTEEGKDEEDEREEDTQEEDEEEGEPEEEDVVATAPPKHDGQEQEIVDHRPLVDESQNGSKFKLYRVAFKKEYDP